MSADYSGTSVPTLNNSPASSWTTDAAKKSHVNDLYLVTGSGASAGNLYAFEEYAQPLVKNATPGEIVTFTDGGDNAPITAATVSLSPIQSLNGYDSPWPAGGGKNKFDQSSFSWSNTTTIEYVSLPIANGTYTFSTNFPEDTAKDVFIIAGQASSGASSATNGVCLGVPRTITVSDGYYTLATRYNSARPKPSDYNWQLEVGSGATDFSPYSNICPISGHTGAELNIAAEYDAEDKTTYSVTFTDQGTVYGGTYDFVSGKLTVDRVMVDLGNLAWSRATNYFSSTSISGLVKRPTTHAALIGLLSDTYTEISSADAYNGVATGVAIRDTNGNVWIHDTRYNDAETFKTAMSGVQLVYPLATPLEYTLSTQQLTTLLGQNVVWGSGPVTQLTYTSNQFTPSFNWFETWTVPKITRDNGQVIVLPKPQEYTPEIYDVDAATTGRNANGTMLRDRVARKHKFNYKYAALSQQDATEILNAVQDVSFTLTTASPETGAKTNYRVYVGDRSLPVYWMPTHAKASWMYSSLSLNLIEM